jgi:hypothetical protein
MPFGGPNPYLLAMSMPMWGIIVRSSEILGLRWGTISENAVTDTHS